MITKLELFDYLRSHTRPSCIVSAPNAGHYVVRCASCVVTVPDDPSLSTTTANEIERRLEPCLGRNWMP